VWCSETDEVETTSFADARETRDRAASDSNWLDFIVVDGTMYD